MFSPKWQLYCCEGMICTMFIPQWQLCTLSRHDLYVQSQMTAVMCMLSRCDLYVQSTEASVCDITVPAALAGQLDHLRGAVGWLLHHLLDKPQGLTGGHSAVCGATAASAADLFCLCWGQCWGTATAQGQTLYVCLSHSLSHLLCLCFNLSVSVCA